MKKICKALECNSTLQILNLYNNKISNFGALALEEVLKINQSLNNINLQSNEIGDFGIINLCKGLELNSKWNPSNSLTINTGFQLLYAKDSDAIKSFNNGEVYARKNPSSPAFQLKKKDYFGLYNRSRTMINININNCIGIVDNKICCHYYHNNSH